MCRRCRKTFTAKTNTFISKTHYLEKWQKYLECFRNNYSIRKTANLVGISVPTAFAWRHKLLNSLKDKQNNNFIGYVETSFFIIYHSEKGNKNLASPGRRRGKYGYFCNPSICKEKIITVEDRFGNRILYFKSEINLSTFSLWETFFPLITEKNTIVGDSRALPPSTFNPKKIKYLCRGYNNENKASKKRIFVRANITESNLRQWLNIFRGIASKNIAKYLKWFTHTVDTATALNEFF